MQRFSIKIRVTAWFTVVMLFVATVMFFLMTESRIRQITSEAERLLVRSVEDFVKNTGAKHASAPVQRPIPPHMQDKLPPPDRTQFHKIPMYGRGIHYAVYSADGELIAGNIPFEAEELSFEEGRVRAVTSSGERYLIFDKKSVADDGSEVWIKGITNLSVALNTVDVTKYSDYLIIALLILFAAAGGYFIVKRALAPVERMSITAKEISRSNNLSQRIALGEGNDEIYRLATVLDDMLSRIESAFETEKQFTSDASHELRTPVTVIISECEYALDCAVTGDEYKESVGVIKGQAEKMNRLISELLLISRMDKNTVVMNRERINLSELLSAICAEQGEINSVKLIEDIQPDVYATADEMLLARLCINLIGNAFQYGGDGEYVKVSLHSDGKEVVIQVEDNGMGIAQEEQEKIWERFYQVNKSRSNDNGSMGLGLAMVKEIAGRHNGYTELESQPGKGSIFRFIMPVDGK